MPEIAIISNSAFSVVNFRKQLIEDIRARGWETYVLAPDFNEDFRSILAEIGAVTVDIRMSRTGLNPVGDSLTLVNLVKELRNISPDITFSYGIKPVVYGVVASRWAGVPDRYAMVAGLGTLYVENGHTRNVKNKLLRKTADLMYRFSLKSARKVFFHNPDDIRLFETTNIIGPEKSVLINGSGVDTEYYRTDTVQTDPPTFTLASRLIKEKGIIEFVECARRLKEKYPDLPPRFILLGDTDLNPNSIDRNRLEQWAREEIVEWPGHVDDVKPWLEKTSVFVLPTYYREGTPKSILEAMSMGRAVITTDTPGCRETVRHAVNGFFVPPENPGALVEACERFIQNPGLIGRMGRKSREMAVQKYDIRKVNRTILAEMGLV